MRYIDQNTNPFSTNTPYIKTQTAEMVFHFFLEIKKFWNELIFTFLRVFLSICPGSIQLNLLDANPLLA
jgi:hypothetical protein